MRKYFSFLLVLSFAFASAQELNCKVTVNFSKVTNANNQVFKTLETALNDFVNKTAWTEKKYAENEKINCSMFITVNSYDSNQFEASIQVQSSRPVFNSSYSSPLVNINDKFFGFKYVEFESLNYNPNSFDSNLISVIAFYSYVIIGMDADSFTPNGGDQYFQSAQDIVSIAAQGGYKGWAQADGNQNRYFLANDIMSPTFKPFRDALYQFHFEGLDNMHNDLKQSKETIKSAIATLSEINATRPNAYLTRVFFDAKADEIISIFSAGPTVPVADLVDNLNKISPTNSSKWSKIKF